MYKRNSIRILGVHLSDSLSRTAPVQIPRMAKQALAIILIISVTGCGGGEGTSETTPTNPEPTQPSLSAISTTPAQIDQPLLGKNYQEIRGDLGDSTLLPGTYSAAQTLEISAGDLILDAQGNVNAVWIFLIAGDLHVADGRRVILSGGAQAANVYWWVGGSAQLGEYSVFYGNILP